ncbi:MAG: NAD(+)/NADH kinase [Bacteroidetes bacterium]|nr:NAD(+)/NADH kinase [Bacteroidota bacterium]MCY4204602.1 NAD(+)/NADH kinase [Bacteroidota bacterium]
MTFGITGNTAKDELWPLIHQLKIWMDAEEINYQLHTPVAQGLMERSLISLDCAKKVSSDTLALSSTIILSIGGDGTLLHTAYEVGASGIPILGINIGYLGFLADVEATNIQHALRLLNAGRYEIESRNALSLSGAHTGWALNDIVITRQPAGGLAAIDVLVDGTKLNRYRGDGLIIATPTGSTAYSLAVGGPIVMPGSNVIIVSPVAPHSLTVRPIVLPAQSNLTVQLAPGSADCTIALDGRTQPISGQDTSCMICRADHTIQLVRFENADYFGTLRSKLSWGMGRQITT